MQIHRKDPVDAGGLEQHRDVRRRYRHARAHLAVLARVPKIGDHGGYSLCRRAAQAACDEEELHQVLIDRRTRGLHHKHVKVAYAFAELQGHLAWFKVWALGFEGSGFRELGRSDGRASVCMHACAHGVRVGHRQGQCHDASDTAKQRSDGPSGARPQFTAMSGTPKCAATLAASLGTELPESICAHSPDRRQRTGTTARIRPRLCTNTPPPPLSARVFSESSGGATLQSALRLSTVDRRLSSCVHSTFQLPAIASACREPAHLEFRRVEVLLHRAALDGGQRASEAAHSPEGVAAIPRGHLPRPRGHAAERALHSC